MKQMTLLSLVMLLIATAVMEVTPGKILTLCPICPWSHNNVMESIAEGLLNRNHSLTLVSSFKPRFGHKNLRVLLPVPEYNVFGEELNPWELRANPLQVFTTQIVQKILDYCEQVYESQEVLNLVNEKWDLIIIDTYLSHCLQGLVHRLNAPVIWSAPLPDTTAFSAVFGNYLPPSFVPFFLLPFSDNMSLLERAVNLVGQEIFWLGYKSHYRDYERVYRKHLGEDLPSIGEIESNISLMLVNQHFALNWPRPTMPDIVPIAGIHCRPGKPLPKDLEDFMNGSPDGVVVFSLGTLIRGKHMPEKIKREIITALGELKQRVVLKWSEDTPRDFPSNVKVLPFLPLQDVLAHPKTQVFITHGGLMSTLESIFHAVPMIGLPLIADQDVNMGRYADLGIAINLEITRLKSEELVKAVNTLLQDPNYNLRAQEVSNLLRDQPHSAKETAIFWIEYVMRHKGAPQLRSAARDLSFIQFHSLDVLAILGVAIFSILVLALFSVWKLYKRFFTDRVKNKKKKE